MLRMNWLAVADQPRTYTCEFRIIHFGWTECIIQFTPEKSGGVDLELMGPWQESAGEGSSIFRQEVLWDNLSAGDVTLANGSFETLSSGLPTSWTRSGDAALLSGELAQSGTHFVKTWHDGRWRTRINVRGGEPVTLRFFARASLPAGFVDSPRIIGTNTPAHLARFNFMRGANIGNSLEAPVGENWGQTYSDADFVQIKAEGFDHVRIPIRWNAYTGPAPNFVIDESFAKKVDALVDLALARSLGVIVNIHHFNEFTTDPAGQKERFYKIWEQIAVRYANKPNNLAFELLNEPWDAATTTAMNPIYAEAIRKIRVTNPGRPIFVGPGDFNRIGQLTSLQLPPEDTNLIVTVHSYEPHIFTHQGAGWAGDSVATRGVIYPGPPAVPLAPVPPSSNLPWVIDWFHAYNTLPAEQNPSGKSAFVADFEIAKMWSDYYGRPIHVGEFGAIELADDVSRANFVRDMRETFDRFGFGWAIWDWKADFQYWDATKNAPEPGMREALFSSDSLSTPAGASVPWTTYEAENMAINGTTLGPRYTPNVIEAESSGRKCVRLSSVGHYVQFTASAPANALVLRYSIPDAPGGGGLDATLSLYKNGGFIGKLPLTSRYSWVYGNIYPHSNTPSTAPRNFYDEVRFKDLAINPGDIIKIAKDAGDTASYYMIDLVDLENVSPPRIQPANSLSVLNYGASGNGNTDDTSALRSCINAALAQGRTVWIPPGNYKITGSIDLPSNLTVQGAGMWHTTLVGDPALYGTSSRRVTLSGNGNNIRLEDFAITGKLNYRNDSEPNDGLGGHYGTGSAISRIWVEHTKTGAWIVNSQGLIVDGCRFRNTIADGINFCIGMRGSTIRNCTTRGTGDDCFAIWPADPQFQIYSPGFNVISHCTGQLPWWANGGALYGGESNRIEDCLFEDMPYGSGILISTTFPVGDNNFSGTTTVQRSTLNRCGGFDPGFQWRGALQFCLQSKDMTGIKLSHLNITNSVSDGVSIIAPGTGGRLSSSVMESVSIPNYGLGASGRHGLVAVNPVAGSMTLTNCAIVEFFDSAPNFNFDFGDSTVEVTVGTSPAGRSFTVDGTSYNSEQKFQWPPGSTHAIATPSLQTGATGTRYVWNSWSDAGAVSHNVAPVASRTYTANFSTQHFLTMTATDGGAITPDSGWQTSGTTLELLATPDSGYTFAGWTGSGNGGYTGGNNAASIVLNGPITQMASFILSPTRILSLNGSFDFGEVAIGSSTNRFLTIRNIGNSALTVRGITYPVGFSGDWSGTMPSGTTVNVPVTFAPVAATEYSGSLTVNSDAENGGNSLPVSGKGKLESNQTPVGSLEFIRQPADALTGTLFAQEVQLLALGINGRPVTNAVITLSLASGTGNLAGTLTRNTDSNGIAHFDDLKMDQPGPKSLSASAAVGNPPAIKSAAILVIGPATATAFTTQPRDVTAGLPFSQPPVIQTVDAFGSPTTLGLPENLPLIITLTNGNGLAGTINFNLGTTGNNGVVTLNDLKVELPGTNLQLVASLLSPPAQPFSGATSEVFSVQPRPVSFTIQTSPSDRLFSVDGILYTNTQTFNWLPGSNHAIAAPSPQGEGAGTQFVWKSWTDNGAISHQISPTNDLEYTVIFSTQHKLVLNTTPGGTVSPAGDWYDSGTAVNLTAIPDAGYAFRRWRGIGAGSYSGSSNPMTVTMNGLINQTAEFELIPTRIISLVGDLNFGDVFIDDSSERMFIITNSGNSELTVFEINYPPGFSGNWTGVIASGASQDVAVTFSPQEVSSYTGVLKVTSDATAGGTELSIAGNGITQTNAAGPNTIFAITVANNLEVSITYQTSPKTRYSMESTTNLLSPEWLPVIGSETNATGSSVRFTDPLPPNDVQRFYRVISR